MQNGNDIRQQILELADYFHHEGQLDDAERLYKGILTEAPANPDALHRLGVLRFRQGQFDEALRLIGEALTVRPDDAVALSNFGLAHQALDRPEAALAHFDKALALRADFPDALNGRGNALMKLWRTDEALASYEQAAALKPDFEQALNGCGNALLQLGRPAEALPRYAAALALKPDFIEALNNRGAALRDLHRPAKALADYDAALSLKPDYAEALNNRAIALADLGRSAEALADYDRAIALRPGNAEVHDNKSVLLTELGRIDEAADAAERAIALGPRRVRSYYNLTVAKRLAPGDPHLRAMEAMVRDAASLTVEERIDLHFALGKALADCGANSESFQHLLSGNALKRGQTVYDEAAVSTLFERTQTEFTEQLMRDRLGQGEPDAAPVFILGMPRSGTTLVEQILASHPQVFGAGETDDFARSAAGLGERTDNLALTPEAVSSIPGERLRDLGARYVERVARTAPAAARITDKTLENFRFVGLIPALLKTDTCPLS